MAIKLEEMLLSIHCSDGQISKVYHFRLFQLGPQRSKIIIFAWLDSACFLPHAYCNQCGSYCWDLTLSSGLTCATSEILFPKNLHKFPAASALTERSQCQPALPLPQDSSTSPASSSLLHRQSPTPAVAQGTGRHQRLAFEMAQLYSHPNKRHSERTTEIQQS